jgi:hypothetical protein
MAPHRFMAKRAHAGTIPGRPDVAACNATVDRMRTLARKPCTITAR